MNVIVIGAGPGGLFATIEMVEKISRNLRILVVDKGKPPLVRKCGGLTGNCIKCKTCQLISGGGGAGLFSDGKLVFNIYSGGYLEKIIPSSEKEEIETHIRDVIKAFSPKRFLINEPRFPKHIVNCLERQGLKFNSYPIIHIGSATLKYLTQNIISYLQRKNVRFLFNTEVKDFQYDSSSGQWIIRLVDDKGFQVINTEYLISSVGKEGNFWFTSLIERMGGNVEDNNTYIGVRIEINESTAKNFYTLSFDPKIYFEDNKRKIKTHCFCRHGQVLLLRYFGLPLAGGHTPYLENDEQYNPEKFPNSNFAVLYQDKKICTKERTLEIMEKVNEITNGKLLIQRLGDFIKNVPTTQEKLNDNTIKPSTLNIAPGQILDEFLAGFREIFISFLERIDSCFPGVLNPDNLLYFPAIEWWMRRVKVNENMEVVNLPNLYAVGDGSGWTQGIVQAAATGIIAGIDICKKYKERMEYVCAK
jgi:uncharacterized FAD-dependent dehydrogenase